MMKKIIIPILMLIALIGLVSAQTIVTLDQDAVLANNTFSSSTSVTPNFNVTGNQSTYTCYLYTDTSGTYTQKETDSGVTNATNTNFAAINSLSDGEYSWAVKCNATTDPVGNWSATGNSTESARVFTIDATDPVINMSKVAESPTAGEWQTNAAVIIGTYVIDNNAGSCILYTTVNATGNSTQTYGAYPTGAQSYTNVTNFNFTGYSTLDTNMSDNGTGAYYYSITCNDSAGNEASIDNITFYIDTTAPSAFDFNTSLFQTNNRDLWNNTRATDYTPQIGWTITTELNFSRYELKFYYNSTLYSATNVTSISTLSANISTLEGDINPYKIQITAYDVAGNYLNMTSQNAYEYGTDSTNRVLKAGWNIIGNVGNMFNLSNLLSWAGATTVSLWNSTHEFVSHVSGGSNGNESVTAGNPVLLYVASNTNFEDLVWNTSAVSSNSEIDLVNTSDSGSNSAYNLIMQRNSSASINFGEIDAYINCNPVDAGCSQQENNASNVDYMSFYNNSVTTNRYVSSVANWSISNTTSLGFGDCVWMNVLLNQTLNWSAI